MFCLWVGLCAALHPHPRRYRVRDRKRGRGESPPGPTGGAAPVPAQVPLWVQPNDAAPGAGLSGSRPRSTLGSGPGLAARGVSSEGHSSRRPCSTPALLVVWGRAGGCPQLPPSATPRGAPGGGGDAGWALPAQAPSPGLQDALRPSRHHGCYGPSLLPRPRGEPRPRGALQHDRLYFRRPPAVLTPRAGSRLCTHRPWEAAHRGSRWGRREPGQPTLSPLPTVGATERGRAGGTEGGTWPSQG